MKNPIIIFITVVACLALAAGQAQAALVGHWKFEEPNGTIYDETANDNDGTYNGALYQQTGQFDYALGFDGTDDFVEVADDASLDFGAGDFTIAGWIKTTDGSANRVMYKATAGGNYQGISLIVHNNVARGSIGDDEDLTTVYVYGTTVVNDDEWHHVAFVADRDGNGTVYVDGTYDAALSITDVNGSVNCNDTLKIGKCYTGDTVFTGLMDDVGLWDEALSAEDINDIYHNGIPRLDREVAYDPDPTGTILWSSGGPTLSWLPGDYVQDVNGHIVYFGTDYNDVTDANVSNKLGVYKGPNDVAGPDANDRYSYQPGTLDYGETYYWRIDEVNDPCVWPGDVWSFMVASGKAELVSPADGATGVDSETVELLNWTAGDYASSHDVYFGTDYNEVTDANDSLTPGPTSVYRVRHQALADVNYTPPEVLELDKTYYWRIDEVNASGEPQWPGDVWRFTTLDYLIIDNFNDYDDTANLKDTWKDWELNGSGATVYLETAIAQDGNSMECTYENGTSGGVYYSEAERSYDTGQDWTRAGVEALVIHFYGDVDNDVDDTEQMYVGLKDSSGNVGIVKYDTNAVATYDGDANDLQKEQWQQWNIRLADFNEAGVDLTDVNSIYIGFGDRANEPPAGGDGTVYFDNFRLYPPRCLVDIYGKPLADIDRPYDCKVDSNDLRIMVRDWLDTDANDEMTYRLAAYYDFETGSGITAYDRSKSALDGTLNGDPNWVSGKIGNYALSFDGTDDFVEVADDASLDFGTGDFTIACWIKTTVGSVNRVMYKLGGGNYQGFHLIVHNNVARGGIGDDEDTTTIYVYGTTVVNDDEWHHIAFVADRDVNGTVYVDGSYDNALSITDVNGSVNCNDTLKIGKCYTGDTVFTGLMDDVRLWDYALSKADIEYLANESTGGLYHGLDSPANLSDDEPEHSKIVNFRDFAVLASMWLDEKLFPPE